MSAKLDLASPGRQVHVGVLLMASETELLDVAPIDFFGSMSKKFVEWLPDEFVHPGDKEQAIDVAFHWVNETGGVAKLTSGLQILATDSFANCPPLDVVLMGAHKEGYEPTEAELDFIRKSYDDCSAFISVCGGFQAPMQAGLYQGKSVTAPRPWLGKLREEVPGTEWVERRWQRDGKLWTSGTLLNGLDLMRGLGEEVYGEDSLARRMLDMGCFPKRPVDYSDVD